jgi:hypothetical protein
MLSNILSKETIAGAMFALAILAAYRATTGKNVGV